jgi:NADH:ubiquinone oxidoreductase subunit E
MESIAAQVIRKSSTHRTEQSAIIPLLKAIQNVVREINTLYAERVNHVVINTLHAAIPL